jgi:hypothetical protein
MDFLKLLPTIFTLMSAAEKLGGPGTGKEKKEAVKNTVKAITSGMESVSGGGQKETWKQIDDVIDTLSFIF